MRSVTEPNNRNPGAYPNPKTELTHAASRDVLRSNAACKRDRAVQLADNHYAADDEQ